MRIVVTGAAGFIGKNLCLQLRERGHHDVVAITRATESAALRDALSGADFVYHLAGVNRPNDPKDFELGNSGFTQALCDALAASGRRVPVAFASSIQATLDNAYGRSKRAAEDALLRHGAATASPIFLLRLVNVFGKWSRPNYNSAVATFCHQVAHGLPVSVNDASSPLRLVYIDDVVAALLQLLDQADAAGGFVDVGPVYYTSVGEVASAIESFASSRQTLLTPRVGTGLVRALYSTYVSHLRPEDFGYRLRRHEDPRGVFVEMLKTPDCGQFSYFTAHPGVTRGEHYHHSKTEKFLVIKGTARFGFRHVDTGASHERFVRGADAEIVETVPGWTHNISNAGDDELVVMLWANEIFDPARPDTIAMKVAP